MLSPCAGHLPAEVRMDLLSRQAVVQVFLAFAFAYFFSALLRAITATLAPVLTQEFALSARELGLLAGGYFLGFAATQLPLGTWLDRHGPKKVTSLSSRWRWWAASPSRWPAASAGCSPPACCAAWASAPA